MSKLKAGDDVVFKVLGRRDTDRTLTMYFSGVVPLNSNKQ